MAKITTKSESHSNLTRLVSSHFKLVLRATLGFGKYPTLRNFYSILLTTLMLLLNQNNAYASAVERLMQHTAPGSAMSNVNKGQIVKEQQGGYMTGGSVIVRGPAPKTLQPLIVQTPKFAFDACTGSADFRFGGLSYISSDEFVRFLKSVSTSSGAYAVKMLIKTVCSQCENIMSDLEAIGRDINGLTLNQCALSQKIAGGAFAAMTNAKQQKCLIQGNMQGNNRDMYEVTNKCKNNPDTYNDLGEKDELKSLLGDEFNLVWKAISRGAGDERKFKEFIMSVSGTIIGKKIDGRYHFTSMPSLILNSNMLDQYIGISNSTSKLKLYECNENTKCLEPKEIEVTMGRNDTLYGNISRVLQNLITKTQASNNAVLTDEEEAVISLSSIPLLNLIELELASKARAEDLLVRMDEFIEVVCYDIITNFLHQMVTKAQVSVEALEYAQLADATPIKDFANRAETVKSYLRDAKFAAFKRLQLITQVKERITAQEKAFEATVNTQFQQMRH